ncbi:cytochrome P450 6a2-like [Venturia canescens]|uniref:cytochrome P450 6a2-like n=1 Tax=Venturia canescens TaxID=32260 RepID=UPI001C9BD245|nr:cytochrome P450 6a2-like [Venturia canescens]
MELKFVLGTVAILLLIYLFHKYFIQVHKYWEKKGIPTFPGAIPFFGHTIEIFWNHRTFACFIDKMYKANKGRSMIGFYQLQKPVLMIQDPELMKSVLISDFPKFHENPFKVDKKMDPLLAENPFFNTGEKWKTSRSRLSYALMSGKRLRILCHSIAHVCNKFTSYLRENVEKSKQGVYEVEMKELGNRFTGEVVANAAFGAEGDFFTNGSGPNSFREAVYGFLAPSLLNLIAQTILFLIPMLGSILKLRFVPKRMDQFFRRVIHEMISLRKKDGVERNDFLQLMLQGVKSEGGEIDENDITASATSFFIDGYETSAITMSFLVYRLAENPKVQEKLRDEIKRVLEKYNGEICYESLKEMTFLDQAFNESMRLIPAVGFLTKQTTEQYKFLGKDGLECVLEPETQIILPLQAIQNDPEYWEDPEVYKPERFNDDSEKNRPKTTFMPFSEGPRICPGMRFATMQIKGAVVTILKDYVVEVSPKTKRPLQPKRGAIITVMEGGLWINFKPIQSRT